MRRLFVFIFLFIFSGVITGAHAQEDARHDAIHIGGSALVYVQDDGLKLRSGAKAGDPVIENLPLGTLVEVIGGPVSDGTNVWWNVHAPSGSEGWAVESTDGIQTLIPYNIAAAKGVSIVSSFQIDVWGIPQLLWSPDDKRVVLNTETAILIYDVETGHQLLNLTDLPTNSPRLTWSSDGRWLQMVSQDEPPEKLGYVDTNTGKIVAQIDDKAVQWYATPNLLPFLIEVDENGNITNTPADLRIHHEAGTLVGGNPAHFEQADGKTFELGNSAGGIGWAEGSSRVVLWSDANSDPSLLGTAEVWDIATGKQLALVPHGSIYLFAGGSHSDPAFLSNDGTMLVGITTNTNVYEGGPIYSVTIYRLTATQ